MTQPQPSRRAVLRAAGTVITGGAAAALLAACTPSASPAGSPSARTTTNQEASTVPSTPSSRVLIAYFSRPGENYSYGDRVNLDVGNTEVLTGLLTDRIDTDVFRIEAEEPYSSSYDATVARNVREQQADARPTIAGALPSLDRYDIVLLGSPIWNVRPPMIMTTFAEAVDWAGKTLHPFVTYAVSGLGQTAQVYRDSARGVRIGDGLAVLGETVTRSGADVDAWLRTIGLAR